MNQQEAEDQIKDWFWKFHNKLVVENPDQRTLFDTIVAEADMYGLLWEVLYFADLYITRELSSKEEPLPVKVYADALIHGYDEWIR